MNDEIDDLPGPVVPIFALDSWSGIDEQNDYLTWRFGVRGVEWEKHTSALSTRDGRWFDRIHIRANGQTHIICFDVTPLMVVQRLELAKST